MDLAQLAGDVLRAQAASTMSGIEIGRGQAFREVMAVIGTASARKPMEEVIRELIALCGGVK